MSDTPQEKIEFLRTEIRRHNRLYYVDARPELSDREFDQLLQQLQELEQQHPEFDSPNSPTKKVGGEPIDGFVTVPHRQPMLSIDNVFDEAGLEAFDKRMCQDLEVDSVQYSIEYKMDGVALALIYEEGILTQALTRGDGAQGDDVTHNARTVGGVPLRLNTPNPPPILEIRGEALIANADFAEIVAGQEAAGENPYRNPRNASAGALKLRDPKECAKRKLRFLAHGLGYREGFECENYDQFLAAIRGFGLPVTPNVQTANGLTEAKAAIQNMIADLQMLEFEVDGLVIKVDSLKQQQQLGATSKAPRWVVAYKWERYEAVTKVREILISVGKTGTLTPYVELDPVEIAGTTVARASLHNRDQIQRLDIRNGDTVVVEKAGKIIPHVVRVEPQHRNGSEKEFVFPDTCPDCQTGVIQDEGGVYIRCPNPNCPAQIRQTLIHFASRGAMDVDGLGEKLVGQLLDVGLISGIADLFTLHERREQILAMERMGEKSADRLLAGIEVARTRPLWRLLTGLNIRHVGASNARVLADRFGTLDEIRAQSAEQLNAVDEIGPIIAESVAAFFKTPATVELVEHLRMQELNFGAPVAETNDGPKVLDGMSVVVTGTITGYSRDEMKDLIRQHGGKASGSVSKKTSLLVAGENAGSKLQKAKDLGVEVIQLADFLARLNDSDSSGVSDETLTEPGIASVTEAATDEGLEIQSDIAAETIADAVDETGTPDDESSAIEAGSPASDSDEKATENTAPNKASKQQNLF